MAKRNGNGNGKGLFIMYDAGTPEDVAREAFERMYGYPPETVVSQPGCVKAGPLKPADAARRAAGETSPHRKRSTIDRTG